MTAALPTPIRPVQDFARAALVTGLADTQRALIFERAVAASLRQALEQAEAELSQAQARLADRRTWWPALAAVAGGFAAVVAVRLGGW